MEKILSFLDKLTEKYGNFGSMIPPKFWNKMF